MLISGRRVAKNLSSLFNRSSGAASYSDAASCSNAAKSSDAARSSNTAGSSEHIITTTGLIYRDDGCLTQSPIPVRRPPSSVPGRRSPISHPLSHISGYYLSAS